MKVIIVDDEQHIIKTLEYYLSQNPAVEVVGTASDVNTAVKLINLHKPDTLLLDVELGEGFSFDILKKIPFSNYNIIFITAHAHYAIDAIKFSAFDYLLKPIQPKELNDVLARLMKERHHSIEQRLAVLEHNLQQQQKPQRVVLKASDKYIVINQDDIIHLEADNSYTIVNIFGGDSIVVSQSLKYFEELLDSAQFLRIHRSYIVNMFRVKCYIKADGGSVVMENSKSLPLAANKKSVFLSLLETV